MQPLAQYMDYRKYLQDFYSFKRKNDSLGGRLYSYAVFAAAADIKSPNYLKLVMEGQRNLSPAMAEKFGRALGFNKAQTEEFKLLVLYNQAEDALERSQHLKQLTQMRVERRLESGEIKVETWEAFPSWVSFFVLQMIELLNDAYTGEQIALLLKDKVHQDSVKKTIEGLIATGFLKRDLTSGTIGRTDKVFESLDNIPPDLIRKLQLELIMLGLDSLFRDSPRDREFGAVTLNLTKDEFERVKFDLRQLKKRWYRDYKVKRDSSPGDRLYQLNIQFFGITDELKQVQPHRTGDQVSMKLDSSVQFEEVAPENSQHTPSIEESPTELATSQNALSEMV